MWALSGVDAGGMFASYKVRLVLQIRSTMAGCVHIVAVCLLRLCALWLCAYCGCVLIAAVCFVAVCLLWLCAYCGRVLIVIYACAGDDNHWRARRRQRQQQVLGTASNNKALNAQATESARVVEWLQ